QEGLAGRNYRTLLAAGFKDEVDQLFRQLMASPGEFPPPREINGLNSDGTEFSAEVAGSLLPTEGPQEAMHGSVPPRSTGGQTRQYDGVPAGTRMLLSVRGTSHRQAADADLR